MVNPMERSMVHAMASPWNTQRHAPWLGLRIVGVRVWGRTRPGIFPWNTPWVAPYIKLIGELEQGLGSELGSGSHHGIHRGVYRGAFHAVGCSIGCTMEYHGIYHDVMAFPMVCRMVMACPMGFPIGCVLIEWSMTCATWRAWTLHLVCPWNNPWDRSWGVFCTPR